MNDNKTRPSERSVADFLDAIEHPRRRVDAQALDALFRTASAFEPVLWGENTVGYGRYHYHYASGREGDWLATGFSPRRANLSIHILPGYRDHSALLARLGKHRSGVSCLYVNKLADIDSAVLEELIRAGLRELAQLWPVAPR